MDKVPEPTDDFKQRVSDAATKLRQQIAKQTVAPSSSAAVKSSSAAASQAAAEIEEFIKQNA